jgi:broad specificity phosphatase PhoE
VAVVLVQHAEKEALPDDPGLTERGRRQAAQTADWLRHRDVRAIVSSPLRRARETASYVAASTGLAVREDARLRERMNWDGVQPLADFLADWARTVADRDFVPACGDSSRAAAERMRACLAELGGQPGTVVVVTHGGVTVDLLRTLLGDDAVPVELMRDGVPSCAVTTLDGLAVVEMPSVAHLGPGSHQL